MFGTSSSRNFKPKLGKSAGWLPAPATFSSINRFKRNNWTPILIILVILWILFNPYYALSPLKNSKIAKTYSRGRPLTSPHVIEISSRYLYPPIEHAELLKQLTTKKLVEESRIRDSNFPEIEKTIIRSLNVNDDPDPVKQMIKEEEENSLSELAKAINGFKNQDKVVYKPKNAKNYPEIIIVTTVDFEKYSLNALTAIVQNRVDYAHQQNYGIYVRWYQEFLPVLNSFNLMKNKEKRKWVRLYCLRAAMFAFPDAKWFWFVDEDALIMDQSINLQDYLLSPEALNPIALKERPIIPPDGVVKTYKNLKAEAVKLIITQSEFKVETNSFLIRNDQIGKSILELWGDKLFLDYSNFPFAPDSALSHILQWHPFILSKTAIIPARTIAAKHSEVELPHGVDAADNTHYYEGDFVVNWNDCSDAVKCELILNKYLSKIEKAKKGESNK